MSKLGAKIGILPGNHSGYIDHLVPLCAELGAPILVTDPWIKTLIELYYPPTRVVLAEPEDYCLDEALKGYDTLIYVHYSRLVHGGFIFHEYLVKQKLRSIFSFHGHPDKFRDLFWIEHVANEDVVLAYGPDLASLIDEKGVEKKPVICGNYRLHYFLENRDFFERRSPFKKEKPVLLYAPTWAGTNESIEIKKYYSPFFSVCSELFETVPNDFQLVVKLHPLLPKMFPDQVAEVKERYPHIFFLEHYPPIYPLLSSVDYYLGDYSSIGYDFLYFDRPLFFLGVDKPTPLQQVGRRVVPGKIYEMIREHREEPLSEARQALYKQTFAERVDLKKSIELCS